MSVKKNLRLQFKSNNAVQEGLAVAYSGMGDGAIAPPPSLVWPWILDNFCTFCKLRSVTEPCKNAAKLIVLGTKRISFLVRGQPPHHTPHPSTPTARRPFLTEILNTPLVTRRGDWRSVSAHAISQWFSRLRRPVRRRGAPRWCWSTGPRTSTGRPATARSWWRDERRVEAASSTVDVHQFRAAHFSDRWLTFVADRAALVAVPHTSAMTVADGDDDDNGDSRQRSASLPVAVSTSHSPTALSTHTETIINHLMGTGNYSATRNNMKLVQWQLMGGMV